MPSNQLIINHTMGDALYRYIKIKMHPLIDQFTGTTIVVRGRHDRINSIISAKEKQDKPFNWQRPTASIEKNILYINCFPGQDYVRHYAALIQTYLHLTQRKNIAVVTEPPTEDDLIKALAQTNLADITQVDCVIVGVVAELCSLIKNPHWHGIGDFRWAVGTDKSVALLGCQFSIWGDIAGKVVEHLAKQGIKKIIYTGKLGGLNKKMIPNMHLATGDETLLNGQTINWTNCIAIPRHIQNVWHGKHVTLFSPIAETKEWLATVTPHYSFVDPEIGHMAQAALQAGINFGYIHLISDNVAQVHHENLSNEREEKILEKRRLAMRRIQEILVHSI